MNYLKKIAGILLEWFKVILNFELLMLNWGMIFVLQKSTFNKNFCIAKFQ
jgi:hypothetical protein